MPSRPLASLSRNIPVCPRRTAVRRQLWDLRFRGPNASCPSALPRGDYAVQPGGDLVPSRDTRRVPTRDTGSVPSRDRYPTMTLLLVPQAAPARRGTPPPLGFTGSLASLPHPLARRIVKHRSARAPQGRQGAGEGRRAAPQGPARRETEDRHCLGRDGNPGSPTPGQFGVHAVPLGSGRQPMAAEIGDAGRTGDGPAAGHEPGDHLAGKHGRQTVPAPCRIQRHAIHDEQR